MFLWIAHNAPFCLVTTQAAQSSKPVLKILNASQAVLKILKRVHRAPRGTGTSSPALTVNAWQASYCRARAVAKPTALEVGEGPAGPVEPGDPPVWGGERLGSSSSAIRP